MCRNRYQGIGSVVVGLGLLVLGMLFLFDRLDIFDVRDFISYWPLILIGVGLTRLGSKEPRDIGFMIGEILEVPDD